MGSNGSNNIMWDPTRNSKNNSLFMTSMKKKDWCYAPFLSWLPKQLKIYFFQWATVNDAKRGMNHHRVVQLDLRCDVFELKLLQNYRKLDAHNNRWDR
jgi:hypothetical protein